MSRTQIQGGGTGSQIKSGTITNTEIASGAAIADTKLAVSYLKADGTRALTGDQSFGGFKATNVADGTADTDAASLGQVRALFNGQDVKASVRVASTANGTFASAFQNGATVYTTVKM